MSKYNLQDILNEYVGGSRHGTIKISYRDLVDAMDTIEKQGDFIVRELPGPSGDGKTNREFEVVYIGNARRKGKEEGGFTVYDYKFGFDPGDEMHFDEEYEFSIGGNNKRNALILARDLLGPAVKGYFGDDQKIVNSYTPQMANDVIMSLDRNMDDEGEMTDYAADVEIDSIDEANTSKLTDEEKKELKFHLDQFKKGNIDREDIMNVLDQFGLTEMDDPRVNPDYNEEEEEIIKNIERMNPEVKKKFLRKLADMGKGKLDEGDLFSSEFDRQELKTIINDLNKGLILDMPTRRAYKFLVSLLDKEDKEELGLSENGHVDDYADEIEEGHAMSDNEADLESGVKGNMDAFTEEFIGESTQEESVAKYIMDYYRNPKTGESMVSDEMVMEYFRTHKDWDQEGRWDGSKEGMEDGMKDFDEFFDANYGYMFDDSRLDEEDKKKKELPDSIKKAEQDQIEKDARKARGDIKEENEEDSLNEVRKHFERFMFKKYS